MILEIVGLVLDHPNLYPPLLLNEKWLSSGFSVKLSIGPVGAIIPGPLSVPPRPSQNLSLNLHLISKVFCIPHNRQ